MSYKLQLRKGKKVEKEHLPFYHKLKKNHKCVSDEKFVEGIAKAHLKEDKNYYDKLNKAGL
jgi:hypothetical protein